MFDCKLVVYLLASSGTETRVFFALGIEEASELLICGRDYALLIQCCKDARVFLVN